MVAAAAATGSSVHNRSRQSGGSDGGWLAQPKLTLLASVSEGWRRGRDSNPRYGFPYSGFQDRLFQPLTHLSGTYSEGFALRLPTRSLARLASSDKHLGKPRLVREARSLLATPKLYAKAGPLARCLPRRSSSPDAIPFRSQSLAIVSAVSEGYQRTAPKRFARRRAVVAVSLSRSPDCLRRRRSSPRQFTSFMSFMLIHVISSVAAAPVRGPGRQ